MADKYLRRTMTYPHYPYNDYVNYPGSLYPTHDYNENTAANMGQSQEIGEIYGGIVNFGRQNQGQKGSGRRANGGNDPYRRSRALASMNQEQVVENINNSNIKMRSQTQGQFGR